MITPAAAAEISDEVEKRALKDGETLIDAALRKEFSVGGSVEILGSTLSKITGWSTKVATRLWYDYRSAGWHIEKRHRPEAQGATSYWVFSAAKDHRPVCITDIK